jgi:hypothetical protein
MPNIDNKMLDDILPIIGKISTLNSVRMGYGMTGLPAYENYDNLCT